MGWAVGRWCLLRQIGAGTRQLPSEEGTSPIHLALPAGLIPVACAEWAVLLQCPAPDVLSYFGASSIPVHVLTPVLVNLDGCQLCFLSFPSLPKP